VLLDAGRPVHTGHAARVPYDADVGEQTGTSDETGVGFAAHAVVAFCVVIPLVELSRAAAWPLYAGQVGLVAVATAVTVPLHLYLVWHAVRGRRAPHGRLVFATLLATSVAAALNIGETWMLMLAFAALGGFLVLPLAAAVPVLVACCGVTLLFSTGDADGWNEIYFAFSVAFRTIALYSLIWLAAAHDRLLAARDRLRDVAVVRERTRIAGELHDVVGPVLERAVAATADSVPDVVAGSRTALLQARRIIGGNRRLSLARELDTALALLAAAGAPARLEAVDVDLDAPATPDFRTALRGTITEVLTRDATGPVVLLVAPGADGPRITVADAAVRRG
jgi:two-component system sensor histidine kinase DesK